MEDLLKDYLIKKDGKEQVNISSIPEEEKVLESERINFMFNVDKFQSFSNVIEKANVKIVPTSVAVYTQLVKGVVPKYFWNNYHDFVCNGGGYTLLLENDVPVSTAFVSFHIDNKLEIGIQTSIKNHGSGFGALVCSSLINYCINNGYEPVWSCNSSNLGSWKLAHKLGFEEIKRIPYYRLPKSTPNLTDH
jgi:hypothetical protein